MKAIRRRARYIAWAWLLVQGASLSAFGADCCASHIEAGAKEKAEPCHDAEPPEPNPGDACPMHDSASDCGLLSNGCAAPGANLVTLFAYAGPIERPVTPAVALDSSPAFVAVPVVPLDHTRLPDSPPPKA
jgi:hypothetical protein